MNDVKSVNINGHDRVDYKSIETDLFHLLGNSPLNLDRKMLSEKIDYSSFSIDENKIDNNVAPITSVDEYEDRVAKRKDCLMVCHLSMKLLKKNENLSSSAQYYMVVKFHTTNQNYVPYVLIYIE